jgi:tetratricopeptide (TPR) repeat protein
MEQQDFRLVEVVRDARMLTESGDAQTALALLEHFASLEVEQYPGYFIALGECQLALGKLLEARRALKLALALVPNSPRAAILMELCTPEDSDNTQTYRLVAPTNAKHSELTLAPFFAEAQEETVEHPASQEPKLTEILRASIKTPATPKATSFDLERVATLLARDRPLVQPTPEVDPAQHSVSDTDAKHATHFVSETLAEILVRQGKLADARTTYLELAVRHPERAPFFESRANALEHEIVHNQTNRSENT